MQLDFNVVGQLIERTDATRVAANSQNWIIASFTFDEEWTGVKTAVFTNGTLEDSSILGADGVGENKCYVPASVMTEAGTMDVSVYAGDLKTTVVAKVRIEESGNLDIDPAPSPSPTQTYIRTPTTEYGIEIIRYNSSDQIEFWNGEEWIIATIGIPPTVEERLKAVEESITNILEELDKTLTYTD